MLARVASSRPETIVCGTLDAVAPRPATPRLAHSCSSDYILSLCPYLHHSCFASTTPLVLPRILYSHYTVSNTHKMLIRTTTVLPVLLLLLSAAYPFRVRLSPCAVFVFFTNAWTIADGTLRWQAPELTGGHSGLTQQVDSDVYAFAITCVGLLTKGKLPWPMADDNTVCCFVLRRFIHWYPS